MRGAAKEKRAGSRPARAAVLLLAVVAVGLLASPASASLPRLPAVGGITGDPLAAAPAATEPAWPPLHTEPPEPSPAPEPARPQLRLIGSGSHGFGLFGRQRPGYDARFLLETRLWAFELDSGELVGLERLQVLDGVGNLRLFTTDRRRGPRNRYYDPELGRFITADPMGYVDGPSMYQFAGYSPANFGDPLGLQHDTQYPLWQAAHPSALPEPEDADWSMRDMARWVLSGYNRPGSQGRAYLSRFKEKWVEEYREVIIQSAITNDLPPELVGGVAFQEVGGDPRWADDLGYFVRSVFPLHVVLPEAQKDPMLTSFGDISMQIRRAAETFDLGPDKMTTAEKNVLIAALKNPEANIRLVSAHLADIRNKLFPAKKAKDLTRDDIRLLATAFNRGPSLSRKELERVPSYGIAVLKHLPEVRRALGTSQPLQSDNTTEKPIP